MACGASGVGGAEWAAQAAIAAGAGGKVKRNTGGEYEAHPAVFHDEGHLGVQCHDGRMEFRNLFVKPL
jgi:hypothetical protein